MNRRSFLSMMGFLAPAVIVKPTYFFAPRDGWGIKIYSTIGAWADYPPDISSLVGSFVSYNFRYMATVPPEPLQRIRMIVNRKEDVTMADPKYDPNEDKPQKDDEQKKKKPEHEDEEEEEEVKAT